MDEAIVSAKINGKFMLMTACLTGIFAIITTLLSINFNVKNNELEHDYESLQIENENLQNEIIILQAQINFYQSETLDNNSLIEENTSLKEQIQQLENELRIAKSTDDAEPETQHNIGLNRNDNNIYIRITGGEMVRVRADPDVSSSIIETIKHGTKILLINTVTGADGYEWYEVSVGDETGYIRSDLASVVE